MEASEQIKKFQDFFEVNYHTELLERVRKGEKSISISFTKLMKFSPELADELLEQPEEVLKAAELAVTNFDFPVMVKNFYVRLIELTPQAKILIRNIRSQHINKLLLVDGTVRQKSDVRPQVTSAKFECPSCGNIINVLQLDTKFKEPQRCGCGRKGRFRLLSKELIDVQGIVLEEATKDLEGGEQPKRINIFLKNDLVSPISEKRTNPGSTIRIYGILKEVPIVMRTGAQSTKFDLLIEANNIEALEEDYTNIMISEEEEEEIKEIAKDPKVLQKLAKSLAPGIYGHDKIKEALVMQFVGGVRKKRDDGVSTRGDMHILLIGDPGAGKCTHGSTKIMLENGELTNIKSFYDKNISFNREDRTTMKIFSINENGLNSTYNPTRFWRRKSPKKLLKITTNTGNELFVTKEHPLFTTQDGLIFAKEAEKYKIGEHIALPSIIKVQGSLQKIPTKIKKAKSYNKVKYNCKQHLDEEFARLLGYLVGDGYVKLRPTTGLISLTNSNKELLNDFEKLVKKVFNLNVSKQNKKGSSSYVYYISSIELFRILEKIDPNLQKRSASMSICPLLCKSPNNVLKEFIKSLFDCEGHVRKNKKEIEFSSKSKELIYDLKYVLLRFGILSQVSSTMKCATNTKNKIKRRYYRLRISGEDVIKYTNKIGFVSKEKNIALNKIINKTNNTNINIVPNLNKLLLVLRKKYRLFQSSFNIKRTTYQHYERGDRFPSKEKLKQIYNKYKSFKNDDPLIEILRQITYSEIFWDKVKSIKSVDCNDDYVYDLEIDNVHNYVANGVVIHNSMLIKRAAVVAPKSRYVSGKGVSGAGLTAAVVKDEFLSGWSLEAGAMVLANKGILMIDEMDKMTEEDRSAMHEGLEQQSISISKANIQATLRCETTVLAAANPKFGRFDPYETIAKQIDLPPALINRFDLIFTIKDIPDEEKDSKLAHFILSLHKKSGTEKVDIETDLLRKYLAYAKQNFFPVLSNEALEEIKTYYVKMRTSGSSEEKGMRAIPISPRQLEALVRLAEASAKVRLSQEITKDDARRAISLLHYCLEQVGLDPETGKIDIDRISTGITTSERSKIVGVRELINDLEKTIGKVIPIDEIIKAGKDKNINEDKILESIEKLKRSGDLFEPKRGSVSKI